MFLDEVKECSKLNKVKVFFDMDGVLVEYKVFKEKDFEKEGFYVSLRPLQTVLNIAKKLIKMKNVEVYILSNCRTIQHKQDKYVWIKRYANFIKQENVIINCYEEISNFKRENKDSIKRDVILKMQEKEEFVAFHIEDDTNIIRIEKKIPTIRIKHVTSLIK